MNKKFEYRDLYIFGISFIIFGLFFSNPRNIYHGIIKIILYPSILISDYMKLGGVGASFVNAGLMCILSVALAHKSKARLTGALVAGILTVTGFSFFGKNLINSLPLMLGVYLYTSYKKINIANFMHVLCFVTGMSPVVSLFIFGLDFSLPVGIFLGLGVGVLIGFIIVPLSSYMLRFHDGYCLYNIGFTIGIIGIPIAGFLRMFDIEIPIIKVIYEADDKLIFRFMLILTLAMVIYGLIINKGLKGYKNILNSSGRLVSDFVMETNEGLALINMGLMGLISLAFVKICGGILNGPVLGGVLTVMGFAAFGKHPKNVIPIILGVYLASSINKYGISSTDAIIVALFSTTLAPIAGEYGIFYGILAGFIHKAVATNVGFLHGGINLYNNGLAGGFVAAILVPLIRDFRERITDD